MFRFFKKKKDDERDDVVIIKKTEPDVCGGTDAYRVKNAPTEIRSQEMTFFQASSCLSTGFRDEPEEKRPPQYVSAFAAPAEGGIFLSLTVVPGLASANETTRWALTTRDIFPELTELVKKFGIAKNNGYHSETHGLPQNFGGSVSIRYQSGETIGISDNQSPVLSAQAGAAIAEVFEKALTEAPAPLPEVSALSSIRFEEIRKNGGFTKARLTFLPDGTGRNEKQQRFDGPEVYESGKEVDAETIGNIRKKIAESGIFAWEGLPGYDFSFSHEKSLTFVFSDGSEIQIKNDRILPDKLGQAFFAIELEMSTKF